MNEKGGDSTKKREFADRSELWILCYTVNAIAIDLTTGQELWVVGCIALVQDF